MQEMDFAALPLPPVAFKGAKLSSFPLLRQLHFRFLPLQFGTRTGTDLVHLSHLFIVFFSG